MSKLDDVFNFYDQFYVSELAMKNGKNLAKQEIKDLMLELSNEFYTKAFNNAGHCEEHEYFYDEWVEFRQKVNEL